MFLSPFEILLTHLPHLICYCSTDIVANNMIIHDNCFQVVANAVAALSEINEASPSGQPLVEMNAQTINKLLTALNECTEWGQVFILDSLANYSPKDDREAQSICERITPRLAHANAAVVLSAVKVRVL